jgi:hypothetical protein
METALAVLPMLNGHLMKLLPMIKILFCSIFHAAVTSPIKEKLTQFPVKSIEAQNLLEI